METENEEEDDNADDEGVQPANMLDQVRAFRFYTSGDGHVLTGTSSIEPVVNRTSSFRSRSLEQSTCPSEIPC